MKIRILFCMVILQCYFSLSATQQNILVGTVVYQGSENLRYSENAQPDAHSIVMYDDSISQGQKKIFQEDFSAIFSPDQVRITDQRGAIIIVLSIDQKEYVIQTQLKDTIDGRKKVIISVYQRSAIRILEQMTKKPILEYVKGKKMLSEIA